MRSLIFNQCRDLITGVMCENLEDLTTVRANKLYIAVNHRLISYSATFCCCQMC